MAGHELRRTGLYDSCNIHYSWCNIKFITTITVIGPCYNESDNIDEFVSRITNILEKLNKQYKVNEAVLMKFKNNNLSGYGIALSKELISYHKGICLSKTRVRNEQKHKTS